MDIRRSPLRRDEVCTSGADLQPSSGITALGDQHSGVSAPHQDELVVRGQDRHERDRCSDPVSNRCPCRCTSRRRYCGSESCCGSLCLDRRDDVCDLVARLHALASSPRVPHAAASDFDIFTPSAAAVCGYRRAHCGGDAWLVYSSRTGGRDRCSRRRLLRLDQSRHRCQTVCDVESALRIGYTQAARASPGLVPQTISPSRFAATGWSAMTVRSQLRLGGSNVSAPRLIAKLLGKRDDYRQPAHPGVIALLTPKRLFKDMGASAQERA